MALNPPPFFNYFSKSVSKTSLPLQFTLMANNGQAHPLCVLAAKALQHHLINQKEWQHNFGLDEQEGKIIGKMFGVLVVQNQYEELGYLAAFSGKLAGKNEHTQFVPPVFDLLTENGFLPLGMKKLAQITKEIKALSVQQNDITSLQLNALKTARKNYSISLQEEIFSHYHFLNQAGEEKSLLEIFKDAGYKNPPAGAGECAGPKLLQYAFQHNMKPLALAEFWWGQSPKSATWKHGHFYPCCKEKCEPILAHMLKK